MLNKVLQNDNKKPQLPATECSTDDRQLHEATLSIQPILDKRLRTNIALLQQMTEKKEIQQINWIDTSSQIANTKPNWVVKKMKTKGS